MTDRIIAQLHISNDRADERAARLRWAASSPPAPVLTFDDGRTACDGSDQPYARGTAAGTYGAFTGYCRMCGQTAPIKGDGTLVWHSPWATL